MVAADAAHAAVQRLLLRQGDPVAAMSVGGAADTAPAGPRRPPPLQLPEAEQESDEDDTIPLTDAEAIDAEIDRFMHTLDASIRCGGGALRSAHGSGETVKTILQPRGAATRP